MSRQPVIGINLDRKDATSSTRPFVYTSIGYIESIVAAGALPLLLPPTLEHDAVEQYLDLCDGIVFTGGKDLDPRNDGFMLHRSVQPMCPAREASDRLFMIAVSERRLPVLGIGVGMQLLNVLQGGNLFLDIPEDLPKSARMHLDPQDSSHRHSLNVEPDSFAHAVYGDGEIRVLSSHHMAIDEVAPGFRVVARSPDGVIEAIQSEMLDWLAWGVQWHPEQAAASALDFLIFENFVAAVDEQRNSVSSMSDITRMAS